MPAGGPIVVSGFYIMEHKCMTDTEICEYLVPVDALSVDGGAVKVYACVSQSNTAGGCCRCIVKRGK